MMPKARIYHLWPRGGFANQMIEYMAALSIRERLEGVDISNITLPQWGISHPYLPSGRSKELPADDFINLETVRQGFEDGFHCLSYSGYAQHIDNFLDSGFYRKIFASQAVHEGWSDEFIVINIRGAEILDARHPSYSLLPISFYRFLIETTGLKPVFMGQIDENRYIDAIKAAFPRAIYVPTRGPLGDFQSLRHSRHVVPSISTFSWLACWLSEARIHLPILGLFNPFQEIGKRFVPRDDGRFSLYQFPIHYSEPIENYPLSHQHIESSWCLISGDMFETSYRQFPRYQANVDSLKAIFDARYYLSVNLDVKEHYGDNAASALQHFCDAGVYENRRPVDIDERFYVKQYPLAAVEIGSGQFRDALQHFAAVGALRGYRPRAD